MKILILNGPNLNMLGIREPEIYGAASYADLLNLITNYASEHKHQIKIFQSNHEGELIDIILDNYPFYDGIVINPAAFTHTSIALFDTLSLINIPTVEVHISDVDNREDFRKVNYIKEACINSVTNEGIDGYITAIKMLEEYHLGHKV